MGDISELRGLIFVVTFMGIFVFLAILIPTEFFTFNPERQVETPDHFEAIDIQFFSETENFTVVHSTYFYNHQFSLGGWNIAFRSWQSYALVPVAHICSYGYRSWWIFAWDFRAYDWFDENGVNYGDELTFAELDSIWNKQEEKQNETITFITKLEHCQVMVYFGWNTTAYSKPSDALNNNEMDVLYAIGMDQINTSVNAWNIVGMLLFFQIPDVHWIINVLINIPMWIVIAYLTYVLVIKVIPLIAGG